MPLSVYRFTIAARLLGVCPDEPATIALSLATPSGVRVLDTRTGLQWERRGEYVLIYIESAPFYDEGVYSFDVAIGPLLVFDIPLVISNVEQVLGVESRAS